MKKMGYLFFLLVFFGASAFGLEKNAAGSDFRARLASISAGLNKKNLNVEAKCQDQSLKVIVRIEKAECDLLFFGRAEIWKRNEILSEDYHCLKSFEEISGESSKVTDWLEDLAKSCLDWRTRQSTGEVFYDREEKKLIFSKVRSFQSGVDLFRPIGISSQGTSSNSDSRTRKGNGER